MLTPLLNLTCTPAGEHSSMDVAGLFYGIGHQPNSSLVSHRVEVDDKGYVKVCGGGDKVQPVCVFWGGSRRQRGEGFKVQPVWGGVEGGQ